MTQNKPTIGSCLKEAAEILKARHLDLNAAEILLETRMGLKRTELWMKLNEEIHSAEAHQFKEDFKRYLQGEPVQYILETAPFYGRDFWVTPDVLIPRPETEELVLLAENWLVKTDATKVLDVCTGSGIIAITLKKCFPDLTVVASDISSRALCVAKENARRLEADVAFKKSDLLDVFLDSSERFDVVVANPPYIAESEKAFMTDYVLHHEPPLALFAKKNGLAIYEQLIHNLPQVVKEQYWIAVEIGYTQGEAVKELFKKSFPQADVIVHKDINQKDRIVVCSNMLV
ncbi:peptide chain release factor N(5)-glutamine methyltransferase [Listeria sp. PSOL-1]|uniref:peptide chain release factor N(5)-glutamine methyltransferase n=1 Tax=Listeria sp. PSOL-1 TaxID=1844999 RepID=UPI0013D0CFBB|nr:peptide chain release factor N(5)-glutamine methyltransferase [Listeria sp. PSOL-1]